MATTSQLLPPRHQVTKPTLIILSLTAFFEQKFNKRHGLQAGHFFNKATFGKRIIIHHCLEQDKVVSDRLQGLPLNNKDKV